MQVVLERSVLAGQFWDLVCDTLKSFVHNGELNVLLILVGTQVESMLREYRGVPFDDSLFDRPVHRFEGSAIHIVSQDAETIATIRLL